MNLSVLLKKLLRLESEPFDTIVCVYTCDKHRAWLSEFYQSIVGQYLKGLGNSKMIEVYADPEIPRSCLRGSKLVLKTQEKYEALSLKTLEMIKYCIRHFEFHHIVKIDVDFTTITTSFEGKGNLGPKLIDIEKILQFLKETEVWSDYNGIFLRERVNRSDVENWAAKKSGQIDYPRLFGDGPMPPFFIGACYVVSHRFAQFISQHGRPVAEEQVEFFLGAEDVMVGRLFQQFQKTIGIR